MKTFETNIKINYHWNCDNDIDIPQKHFEALEEDAHERIFEQIKEGNTSGELLTLVRFGKDIVPEEDEENGLYYSGWWSLSMSRV